MSYRRTHSLNRSRGHWRQEYASAAAVRKCQEQHGGEPAKPVNRPKPSQPPMEFRMAVKRKAIAEPDFPLPAFDADSMTDEQLCLHLFDASGPVGSPACDAYIAWNKAVQERIYREWQAQAVTE